MTNTSLFFLLLTYWSKSFFFFIILLFPRQIEIFFFNFILYDTILPGVCGYIAFVLGYKFFDLSSRLSKIGAQRRVL